MGDLLQKIKTLYPEKAVEVHDKLVRIIDDFKSKRTQTEVKPLFTEQDVILVCYADHVSEPAIKTFKTMHKFLQEFAKGIINKVHFLPFFPYTSDDGFSVVDYYAVNEPFGSWEDLRSISKDFSIMADCVANHVSVKSEWFKKFLEGDAKYKNFFIAFDKEVDTSTVFRPRTSPLFTTFETNEGKKFVWTTFSDDQVDINYSNPDVFLDMVKVLLFYIENGIDAIRLDAIAYAWKKLGTTCFDLPELHTLVQLIHDVFKEADPNVWLITETVLPHKENTSYFGDGNNEANLIYNFVLETLLLHTFLQQDSSKATEWLSSIGETGNETALLNLSISHDGIHTGPARDVLNNEELQTIADECVTKGGKVLYRTSEDGGKEPYEFNITFPSAIGSIEGFLASQSIQLAIQGVPLIYFNNFIGAKNWSEGVEKLGYSRAINRQKFNYDSLVAELNDSNSNKYKVYTGYTKMIKARINEPLFSPLAGQKILNLSPSVVAILRRNDSGSLLAITNVTEKEVSLNVDLIKDELKKDQVKDVLLDHEINLENGLILSAYEVKWLK